MLWTSYIFMKDGFFFIPKTTVQPNLPALGGYLSVSVSMLCVFCIEVLEEVECSVDSVTLARWYIVLLACVLCVKSS